MLRLYKVKDNCLEPTDAISGEVFGVVNSTINRMLNDDDFLSNVDATLRRKVGEYTLLNLGLDTTGGCDYVSQCVDYSDIIPGIMERKRTFITEGDTKVPSIDISAMSSVVDDYRAVKPVYSSRLHTVLRGGILDSSSVTSYISSLQTLKWLCTYTPTDAAIQAVAEEYPDLKL